MTKTEFYFREGTEDDAPKIVELFNAVFGKSRTIKEWRWRFLESPVKKLLIMLALDGSDNIICHYALHPIWLTYKGEKILGANTVDIMVHKDFRKRGLFVETARRCYQLARNKGIKLLYVFPNENSYHRFVNDLKWMEAAKLSYLYYITNIQNFLQSKGDTNPIASLLFKIPLMIWFDYSKKKITRITTKLPHCQISEFDYSFDSLWLECKSQFSVGLWKDFEYLQWRYSDTPQQKYTVVKASNGSKTVGFIVITCKKERNLFVGNILDVLACEPIEINTKALIRTALSLFDDAGIDIVKVLLSPVSHYWRIFRSSGFFHFFRGVCNTNVLNLGDPSDYEMSIICGKWHMTGGDTDFM